MFPILAAGVLVGLAVAVYLWSDDGATGVTADVLRLTGGARARLAWCEQRGGDTADVTARGAGVRLMGLDTADRLGPRPILPMPGSYFKPLITPRGDRIVYTDWKAQAIRVVRWDGGALTALGTGVAVAVWLDPVAKREWVYALSPADVDRDDNGRPLYRFLLDVPSVREVVWEATPVTLDNLRVSADGRFLGGLFPWPQAGIADVSAGTVSILGRGCWPSLAPGDSRLLWVFDGPHRNVVLHTPDGQSTWTVTVNTLPDTDDAEVYHPRWSNHERFLCVTGPYTGGDSRNRVRAGGRNVEVYLGRLDCGLTAVERWVRITRNDCADSYPDAWVDPVGGVAAAVVKSCPAPTVSPGTPARLVVEARLLDLTPDPTLASIAPYRSALVVHRYEIRRVVTGTLAAPAVRVAHWSLREGRQVLSTRRPGDTVRLVLEPFDRHPELEGERVIMSVPSRGAPLFYAVEGP